MKSKLSSLIFLFQHFTYAGGKLLLLQCRFYEHSLIKAVYFFNLLISNHFTFIIQMRQFKLTSVKSTPVNIRNNIYNKGFFGRRRYSQSF